MYELFSLGAENEDVRTVTKEGDGHGAFIRQRWEEGGWMPTKLRVVWCCTPTQRKTMRCERNQRNLCTLRKLPGSKHMLPVPLCPCGSTSTFASIPHGRQYYPVSLRYCSHTATLSPHVQCSQKANSYDSPNLNTAVPSYETMSNKYIHRLHHDPSQGWPAPLFKRHPFHNPAASESPRVLTPGLSILFLPTVKAPLAAISNLGLHNHP